MNGMKIKTVSIRQSMVSHCYRGEDDIIRIISARKATRNETKTYKRYAGGGYERRI